MKTHKRNYHRRKNRTFRRKIRGGDNMISTAKTAYSMLKSEFDKLPLHKKLAYGTAAYIATAEIANLGSRIAPLHNAHTLVSNNVIIPIHNTLANGYNYAMQYKDTNGNNKWHHQLYIRPKHIYYGPIGSRVNNETMRTIDKQIIK